MSFFVEPNSSIFNFGRKYTKFIYKLRLALLLSKTKLGGILFIIQFFICAASTPFLRLNPLHIRKVFRFFFFNFLFFCKLIRINAINSIYHTSVYFTSTVNSRFYIFLHCKNTNYYGSVAYFLFALKQHRFDVVIPAFLLTSFGGKFTELTSNAQLQYNNFELNNFEVLFLRKNRIFNKGRYSRNRQNYRTGVYICFYLSIISIFGLYYVFYRFSFNFSYVWFLFFFFVGSFFFSKVLNLFSLRAIKNSIINFLNWIFLLRF